MDHRAPPRTGQQADGLRLRVGDHDSHAHVVIPGTGAILAVRTPEEHLMLDAFIIDRIRRERESRERGRVPLHIEVPRPEITREDHPVDIDPDEEVTERGIVIIDFTI